MRVVGGGVWEGVVDRSLPIIPLTDPPRTPPLNNSGPNAASSMTLPQFWDVAEEAEAEGALGSVLSLPALMRRLGMAAVVEEEEEDDEEEQDEGDESD